MFLIPLFFGFVLDLIFGDPARIPHPICLIGNAITAGERWTRKRFAKTDRGEASAGILLVILIVILSFVIPAAILFFVYRVSPWLAIGLETIMCWQILAARSLKKESMKVYDALKDNDMTDARMKLSMIVGRDTASLDHDGITRAAVETIAENTSDGVVAPMLFMAIGGAPLGFLYKSVNTLDSMIGYKNSEYLHFGRFAAKLDDVLNFVPSRFSAIFMMGAAYILRFDARNACKIFKRDRFNHASPNSAQTESVCAGALNIQLAGNTYYFGELYEKPTIGDSLRPIEADDIKRANRLLYGTVCLGLPVCLAVRVLVYILIGATI